MMKIGELSRRSGVATSAIRFYEEQGLLTPSSRTASGYREYGDEALDRLEMMQLLKKLGFSLDVIGGMTRLLRAPEIRLIVEWHPVLQEAAGYTADALPRARPGQAQHPRQHRDPGLGHDAAPDRPVAGRQRRSGNRTRPVPAGQTDAGRYRGDGTVPGG